MFESNPSFHNSDSDLDRSAPDSLDIESILHRSNLPKDVKTALDFQVFERLMDAEEIARLTDPSRFQQDGSEYVERLQVRRKVLGVYLESTLLCVLIRLPGVTYTIEIDPVAQQIVHWEWQRA